MSAQSQFECEETVVGTIMLVADEPGASDQNNGLVKAAVLGGLLLNVAAILTAVISYPEKFIPLRILATISITSMVTVVSKIWSLNNHVEEREDGQEDVSYEMWVNEDPDELDQ